MSAQDGGADIYAKRALAIREEMKFEVGIMHDRINTLVSAEAFLTISFTMSLTYVNGPVVWPVFLDRASTRPGRLPSGDIGMAGG